jgi:hypothetical protein
VLMAPLRPTYRCSLLFGSLSWYGWSKWAKCLSILPLPSSEAYSCHFGLYNARKSNGQKKSRARKHSP